MTTSTGGIVAIVLACVVWGLSPIYYKPLEVVPTTEVLAHRTLWSLIAFSLVLVVQGRLGDLRAALAGPRAIAITLVATAMISVNWFLFIYSVQVGRVAEAALGYYIFPLVAVLIGVVTFGERLGRLQWAAVAIATVAVLVKTWAEGVPPWIGLVLAVTFGVYGTVKKRLSAGPVATVSAEVALITPLSLGYLVWQHGFSASGGVFGADWITTVLLAFSGVMTALPLMLFSSAAQRVPMATVGLVQYVNPTLQFFCAVVVFGEPFGPSDAVVFGLIWAALALYSAAGIVSARAARKSVTAASADPPI